MPVGCKRNKPYSLAPWPAKASARGSSPGDTGSHIDGIWTQYLSHILWRSASPDWWLCCSRWKMLLCWFWIGACFPPLLCPLWLFVRPPLARPPDLFDSLLGSLLRAQRHIVRKVPRQNPFPLSFPCWYPSSRMVASSSSFTIWQADRLKIRTRVARKIETIRIESPPF